MVARSLRPVIWTALRHWDRTDRTLLLNLISRCAELFYRSTHPSGELRQFFLLETGATR